MELEEGGIHDQVLTIFLTVSMTLGAVLFLVLAPWAWQRVKYAIANGWYECARILGAMRRNEPW